MSEMTEEEVRERFKELGNRYKDDPDSLSLYLINSALKNEHVDERMLFNTEELIREWDDPDIEIDVALLKKFYPFGYENYLKEKAKKGK